MKGSVGRVERCACQAGMVGRCACQAGMVERCACQAGMVERCACQCGKVEGCVCQGVEVKGWAVTLVRMWMGVLEMTVVIGRLPVLQLLCCEALWCLNQGWKS